MRAQDINLPFLGDSAGKESACKETQVQSLGQKIPLEKGMATHSSILAWRIPWTDVGIDHFVMYRNIESLCCVPGANIVL